MSSKVVPGGELE